MSVRTAAVGRRNCGGGVRTLLIPYLCWSGIWLAVYAAALRSPAASLAAALDGPAADAGPVAHLWAWVGDPVAGQLWFLRDLVLLTALAPLFAALPGLVRVTACLGLFGAWAVLPEHVVISGRPWWAVVSPVGAFWFFAGAACGLRRFVPPALPPIAGLAAVAVWCAACAAHVGLLPIGGGNAVRLADRLSVVAGLSTIWTLAAWRDGRPLARPTAALAKHAFILYAAHFPPVAAAVVLGLGVTGCGPWERAAVFAGATGLVLAAGVGGCELLGRLSPRLHGLLSGHRGGRPPAPSAAVAPHGGQS